MTAIRSALDNTGEEYAVAAAAMTDKLAEVRVEADKAIAGGGEKYIERHRKRGKLLARERIELIIDEDSPFLELCTFAAWGSDFPVGANVVTGIGVIEGVECMIVANDPTSRGGASNPYSAIATDALAELAAVAGPGALTAFARTRFDRLAEAYRPAIEAAGPDPVARAEALTRALTADGFAATLRPVGADGHALQLCQGHCPIQAVAEEFPQLCQAETDTFSDLLGVHVQRLATLAQGEHVCTTHVPLFIRSRTPDDRTNEKESDDH